ncbi:hypothetical protein K438DRAFT_1996004 [Mycena galopus ATCC 62051]|nr:hypothetical protein K438DRAFT_1996004 [Mycena galopus ATCC 62051]
MAFRYHWYDPQGVQTVTAIVKKRIPQWKDGLYTRQRKLIVRILDGEDIFCSMATGGDNSALFAVLIIVLAELALHPGLYPDLPVTTSAPCSPSATEAGRSFCAAVLELETGAPFSVFVSRSSSVDLLLLLAGWLTEPTWIFGIVESNQMNALEAEVAYDRVRTSLLHNDFAFLAGRRELLRQVPGGWLLIVVLTGSAKAFDRELHIFHSTTSVF